MALAQRDTHEQQTAAASCRQTVQPMQQLQRPRHGQQPHQQMQQQRPIGAGLQAPSGSSLPGNEDSLCAFLGGWRGPGGAQQPGTSRGRPDDLSHAAMLTAGYSLEPLFTTGGTPRTGSTSSPKLQQSSAAKASRAALAERSSADVPAQSGPAPHTQSPAAAEKLVPTGQTRKDAPEHDLADGTAAEQLMHAEGEDFWRSLLSIVRHYQGDAASRTRSTCVECCDIEVSPGLQRCSGSSQRSH